MLCRPRHSVHGLHGSVALTTSENVTPEDTGTDGEASASELSHLGGRASPELSFSSLTQYTGAGRFQAHFGLTLK